MMKKLLFIIFLTLLCIKCETEHFDINDPDVRIFVAQLKEGTYNFYEKGESGENLWLLMPKFTKRHIQSLIYFAKDTAHIKHFPTNPISSRTPYPEGREYFILGECLLWTVEGIRNRHGYGSLDPILIDTSSTESVRFRGLKAQEILTARDAYQNWWNTYRNSNWQEINPLKETPYKWF